MLEILLHFFVNTTPFFLLIGLGFLAVYFGLFPFTSISGVNFYVLYGMLPCLLFDFVIKFPIDEIFNLKAIVVYAFAALFLYVIGLLLNRYRGKDWGNSSFSSVISIFPNTGLMGLSLIASVLGDEAVPIIVLILCFDMVVSTSVALGFSKLDSASDIFGVIKSVIAVVLKNPLAISVLLGVIFVHFDMRVPGSLMNIISLQAMAAPTLALFILGAVIAKPIRAKRNEINTKFNIAISDVKYWVVFFKLIIHPAIILILILMCSHFGVQINPQVCTALVLGSALPCASNVPILAERNGLDADSLSMAVVISTLFAAFSFPIWAALIARIFL